MSGRIHILKGSGHNLYQAVIHIDVPVGNNQVGVSWQTALVNSGSTTPTIMQSGNGPGQIPAEDINKLANGQMIEAVIEWENNPAWSTAERLADINRRADETTAQLSARLREVLAFFGAEA